MLLSTKCSHCSDTLLPHNATHINNRSMDNHPAGIVSLESCFQLYQAIDGLNYPRLIAAVTVINVKYAVVPDFEKRIHGLFSLLFALYVFSSHFLLCILTLSKC